MTSGRAFARIAGRTLGLFALIVFFYLVYCGVTVGKLLDEGTLRGRTALCLDAGHLRKISDNTIDDQFRTNIVARALNHGSYQQRRSLPRLTHHASVWIGLKLFWTDAQRRQLYEDFENRMRLCDSALKRYKERTGNDWVDPG